MRNSFLANPNSTLEILDAFKLRQKKSMGQHFLVDDSVIGKILNLAQVSENDVILEVGPGIGTLTVALLCRGAKVISIEKDALLLPVLDSTCSQASSDVSDLFALVNMDACDFTQEYLEKVLIGFKSSKPPSKFVSNLPYCVASTLVLDYLRKFESIQSICVMVQSEVADRMRARPSTKDYSAYSIKIQLITDYIDSFTVKPSSFLPPPNVDSKVIRLDKKTNPGDEQVINAACLVADAAFFQRRKTIKNSMTAYFSNRDEDGINNLNNHGYSIQDMVGLILNDANIDPGSRGETHSVDAYIELGKAYLSLVRDL